MCERGELAELYIDGATIEVDACIAEKVQSIVNVGMYETLGCCCGHGKYPPTIIVREKGTTRITEYNSVVEIHRKRKFYKLDSEGIYFLPERGELDVRTAD